MDRNDDIMDLQEMINDFKTDKKKWAGCCCLLFVIFMVTGAVSNQQNLTTDINVTTEENLFDKSISIRTSEWDYNPEGYFALGDGIYGTCEGVTSDGKEHTYCFTGKQMAALGNISDYTFEYNDLHIIAECNDRDHEVVTHMFYRNGTEIPLVWDEYDFAAYAKVAGADNPNCVEYFGYTVDEMNEAEGY